MFPTFLVTLMLQVPSRITTYSEVSPWPWTTITHFQELHRMQEVKEICGEENAWSDKLQDGELTLICDKILEDFERWAGKQASSPGAGTGSGRKPYVNINFSFITPFFVYQDPEELWGSGWWQSDWIGVLVLNDFMKIKEGKERVGKKETRTVWERDCERGKREKRTSGRKSRCATVSKNNCLQMSGDLLQRRGIYTYSRETGGSRVRTDKWNYGRKYWDSIS